MQWLYKKRNLTMVYYLTQYFHKYFYETIFINITLKSTSMFLRLLKYTHTHTHTHTHIHTHTHTYIYI